MRSLAKNLSATYVAEPDAVPAARHAVSEFAHEAGADADQIEAIRLATSEALTNSVLHAYRGQPGNVYVTAAVVASELWVLIADDGRGLEPQTDRPGLGLGLGLISQVTDELAIVPRAGGGTEVRMRFDLAVPRCEGREHGSESPGAADSRTRGTRFFANQQYA